MKTLGISLSLIFFLSQPSQAILARGGADAGGGNSVGSEFFDDYENKGTQVLSQDKLRQLTQTYLDDIRSKVPLFAEKLEQGFNGVDWYLEPKPLAQNGACVNETFLKVDLVVRACQSRLAVRMDMNYFNKNPRVQGALILHELLVYLKIHHNTDDLMTDSLITDEGVRVVSRALRNPSLSALDLVRFLNEANFGDYLTADQIFYISRQLKAELKALCSGQIEKYKKISAEIAQYISRLERHQVHRELRDLYDLPKRNGLKKCLRSRR